MARVIIESDDRQTRIQVLSDEEGAYGWCSSHDEIITDQGVLEDTIEAIRIHIDRKH